MARSIDEAPVNRTPALQIEHLSKNFGAMPAVIDLSLQVEEGEMFALLGPNGAGKSTTINLVTGVCRLTHGSIAVFGHDVVRDYRASRWLVGVMHQEIVIDHFFSIDRALSIHSGYYGIPDDPAWRHTLIERLGLGPHLQKPMVLLSGGLKRRFMVAKALIHRPRLLILDEPTAGVDVELRHSLWEFVRDINRQGVTVVLTTHYLEEAEQLCDRIAIMHQGRLVALDRKPELLHRCGKKQLLLKLAQPLAEVPASLLDFAPQLEEGGFSLRLSLPPDRPAGDALRRVAAARLEVEDVETRQPDLEDIFLELTGMNPRRLPATEG